MKLLIVGSRTIENFDLTLHVPKEVSTVISGGAKGIDSIAERFADMKGLSKYIIRPLYQIYGKAAPLKRNEEMVELADAILIIWDGKSKGASYTLEYAKAKGKPYTLITV